MSIVVDFPLLLHIADNLFSPEAWCAMSTEIHNRRLIPTEKGWQIPVFMAHTHTRQNNSPVYLGKRAHTHTHIDPT